MCVRDEFEQELKQSLTHVPVPEGFADRVMERVAKKERLRFRVMPQRIFYVWQALAAMLLLSLLFGAAELVHRQQERRQAELVQHQFEVAMRVTGRTLDGVGERISRAGMKPEKREQ
jgi:predicted DNA binding CopG/RHH family protein